MIWRKESFDAKTKRLREGNRARWEREREWHPWFAWRPVEVAPDKTAWLRIVERRLDYLDRDKPPMYFLLAWLGHEYRIPTPEGGG